MKTLPRFLLFCALSALPAAALLAQASRPSPSAQASVQLKGKTILIDYCRPSMRGRKIMGGLVPYGEVWRTGANEATALKTPLDLEIGTAKVPAGSYTLYTLPSETAWKLIINKQTGQWGTEYDPSPDLARVDLKKMARAPLEQFTISFVKNGPDTADLVLEWEATKLTVPVRAK